MESWLSRTAVFQWAGILVCAAGCAGSYNPLGAGGGWVTTTDYVESSAPTAATVSGPETGNGSPAAEVYGRQGSATTNRFRPVSSNGTSWTSQPSQNTNPDQLVKKSKSSEEAGRIQEAEALLQEALAASPNHVPALLALAHLLDRRGDLTAARATYERARRAAPENPTPTNDLGLCLARQGLHQEAVKALNEAIRLEPSNKRYRNNLATVLVEMGEYDLAYKHLAAVHGEVIAHYNLGVLLHRRDKVQAALLHFRAAGALDPTFAAAKQWTEKLSVGNSSGTSASQLPTATAHTNQLSAGRPSSRDEIRYSHQPGAHVSQQNAPAPPPRPEFLNNRPWVTDQYSKTSLPEISIPHAGQQSVPNTNSGPSLSAGVPPTPEEIQTNSRLWQSETPTSLPSVDTEFFAPSRY